MQYVKPFTQINKIHFQDKGKGHWINIRGSDGLVNISALNLKSKLLPYSFYLI